MPPSSSFPELPVKITLIRIAPRSIDDDNLQFAMKEFRDFIADALIPGLPMGRADGDERLIWKYQQKKDEPKKYAIKIIIESVSLNELYTHIVYQKIKAAIIYDDSSLSHEDHFS